MLKRRKAINKPVAWNTEDERRLLKYIKNEVFDARNMQKNFPDRTMSSIRNKVRKLRIKNDLFGILYRKEKEDFTIKIARLVKPKIVFEAYAGAGHQTIKWIEIANKVYASENVKSKFKQFETELKKIGFKKTISKNKSWKLYKKGNKEVSFYSGDAIEAAANLRASKIKIDLIDLDTCGSSLLSLPTFLVLLKPKNIIITHGEFHSMRFQRDDVLRRLFIHKDISKNPFPLTVDTMSKELDRAVKVAALRAHNETTDSFWLKLKKELWIGSKFHGMLRRHYQVEKPAATSDCINSISN